MNGTRFSGYLRLFILLMVAMTLTEIAPDAAEAKERASHFTLKNGMEVVVIPDHRAPVVTHMVWYRVGSADETPGKSGIAHFLEHLMFKGTDKIARGAFSKIISRNGGQDNAFTSQDTTSYHQRVAKDRLELVMDMEADRMTGLKLLNEDVLTERDVILEERRSRVDNSPQSILNEELLSALYQSHPYGIPVIGWHHEMAELSRSDAFEFYKNYYAPNNAVLIVAGDVTRDEVEKLAKKYYEPIPTRPEVKRSIRSSEPPHRAARRVKLVDPRAGKPMLERLYLAPSYSTAKAGEAEAIDLLIKITSSGSTSRFYKKLVIEQRKASAVGGWYTGTAVDSGRIGFYAMALDGVSMSDVEASMEAVLDDIKSNGVTEKELERAKSGFLADYVYENDSQSSLARRYGWGLITGQKIADIEAWPDRVSKVSVADIQAAAKKFLDIKHSVTGELLLPTKAKKQAVKKQAPASKS